MITMNRGEDDPRLRKNWRRSGKCQTRGGEEYIIWANGGIVRESGSQSEESKGCWGTIKLLEERELKAKKVFGNRDKRGKGWRAPGISQSRGNKKQSALNALTPCKRGKMKGRLSESPRSERRKIKGGVKMRGKEPAEITQGKEKGGR